MKKLYYLLITLMGVCMVACGNDDGVDNSQPKPEVPEPNKITLSQQTIEVGFEPDTYSINVTSPYSWDAVSKNDWIVVDSPTGIAGTEQLTFSIARNEDEKVRKGTIVVKNSDYNLITEFYITQTAFVPEISIAPKTLNFSIGGGEESIAVTANFTHKATTDADWLSITKTEEGYTLTVPEYLEVDSRTAEVVIYNEKYGISEIVNITQSAFVPSELSITTKTLNFSAIGGEECVVVTANFEHSATTDTDWVTITKTDEGYIIKASANPELEERTAEVVIYNEKYGISEIVNITQSAFVPSELSITTKTLNFSAIGGEECVVVTANFEHSATTDTDWVTITKTDEGYIIKASANPELEERTAEVVISNEKYNISETIQITQEGPNKKQLIYYTSKDEMIVEPYFSSAFGANIISNIYKNGIGVIVFDGEVTTIGDYAFSDCSSLTSVTIPDSVITIGDYAFRSRSSLTSVTIGDSVTTIGDYAFSGCNSLTSVTIPDSVITIGDDAFYNCSSLTSITIGNSVTTIGGYAFSGCSSLTSVTIPDSVITIGDYAFYWCDSLTSVTIGDSVTTIGDYAFSDCSSLTSVTIPDSVITIGDYAFRSCSSLTSVTIGDSVTTIGSSAFKNCTGELVVNCNIPSASSSQYGAFYGSEFTSVTIGDGVTTIGDWAFYDSSSLTSVTIPDSVTTIGDDAFYWCDSLTSVTIPDSVTTIGDYAFCYCYSLTSVTIGDSVTTIETGAFYNCSSLTSVTIPDSVTTIGNGAFYKCSSLTSVYCKAVTPPTGGNDMFSYHNDYASTIKPIGCTIYVPTESVEAYKSASYWSDYAGAIVGYEF